LHNVVARVTANNTSAERSISIRVFNSNEGDFWEMLGERREYDSGAPNGVGALVATYAEGMVVAPHPDYANGAIFVLGGRSLITGANVSTVYVYHTDDQIAGSADRAFKYQNLNRPLHAALNYFGTAFVQHSYGGYIYVVGGARPNDPQNPHSTSVFEFTVQRLQVSDGAGNPLPNAGNWQAVKNLPQQHWANGNPIRGWAEFALVANDASDDADDRLYLLGGRFEEEISPGSILQQMNSKVLMFATPDSAALNGPGGDGAWYVKADDNTYLPRRFPSASIVDGKIYLAAGRTALSGMSRGIEMVQPSPIGDSANIQQLDSTNFPTLKAGVYYAVSAQDNDRLWMVGGWNDFFQPLPHLLSYQANAGAGVLREHAPADFGTGFGGGAILNGKLYLLTGISHGGYDHPTGLRYHIP
ncbi:MAG: hypothetical protein KDB07_11695, partial [Planctomycetes bacterium]|nr:hypothetical protein [Planctomycetota bacterium]